MLKYISLKALNVLLQTQYEGKKKLLSLKYIEKGTGAILIANNVTCTSSHYFSRTINIRFENGEVRTLRRVLLVEFNGLPVII